MHQKWKRLPPKKRFVKVLLENFASGGESFEYPPGVVKWTINRLSPKKIWYEGKIIDKSIKGFVTYPFIRNKHGYSFDVMGDSISDEMDLIWKQLVNTIRAARVRKTRRMNKLDIQRNSR